MGTQFEHTMQVRTGSIEENRLRECSAKPFAETSAPQKRRDCIDQFEELYIVYAMVFVSRHEYSTSKFIGLFIRLSCFDLGLIWMLLEQGGFLQKPLPPEELDHHFSLD